VNDPSPSVDVSQRGDVEHLSVTPDLAITRILPVEKAQHVRFEIAEQLNTSEIAEDDCWGKSFAGDARVIVDAVIDAMLAIECPRDVISLLLDGARGFIP
jgi:hypothetical protein